MVVYLVLNIVVLFLGALGCASGNRKIDLVAAGLICLLIFSYSLFREVGLADDQNYLTAFGKILSDPENSPIKYGILYQAYVMFMTTVGLLSVQTVISGPIIILLFVAFFSKSNVAVTTSLFFFSFQVPIFIQNRQALALAIVLLAFANLKAGWRRNIVLLSSALAHISSGPFVLLYAGLRPILNRIGLKSICFLTAVLSLGFAALSVFGDRVALYSELTNQLPILRSFASIEAITAGRVGLGGVFWYGIVISIFFVGVNRASIEGRTNLKVMLLGSLVFTASIFFPLLQRLVLPFLVMGIYFSLRLVGPRTKILMLCAGFLLSTARMSKFANWEFCQDCWAESYHVQYLKLMGSIDER